MSAIGIGCERTDGDDRGINLRKKKMEMEGSNTSEKIIVTKRGTYGRVQVTLPMPVKNSMISWMKKSGIGKAEFFRMALMIGVIKLADDIRAKEPNEGFHHKSVEKVQATART